MFNYFLGACLKSTTINQTKPVGQMVYIVKLYDNNILPYEVKNNVFFSLSKRTSCTVYFKACLPGIGRIVIMLKTRHFPVYPFAFAFVSGDLNNCRIHRHGYVVNCVIFKMLFRCFRTIDDGTVRGNGSIPLRSGATRK